MARTSWGVLMLGGTSFSLTPTNRANAMIGKMPYQPWANTMTLSRVCSRSWRRQREHQQGEEYMHPHRPFGFGGGMAQVPLGLGFLDAAVLDETAVVIDLQPRDTHDLCLQPFGSCRFPLPMADGVHAATDRDPLPGRGLCPSVHGHRHIVFRRDHKEG